MSDRIGFLPARLCNNRKNPLPAAVREIVVKTETGKTLRILTNDLGAPAQEIADLYRRRWQIELFFRVKRTTFLGRSENAVPIQIAVARIAFLLLRRRQEVTKAKHGFLELVRLVRANLMHRKDVRRLRDNSPPRPDCRDLNKKPRLRVPHSDRPVRDGPATAQEGVDGRDQPGHDGRGLGASSPLPLGRGVGGESATGASLIRRATLAAFSQSEKGRSPSRPASSPSRLPA